MALSNIRAFVAGYHNAIGQRQMVPAKAVESTGFAGSGWGYSGVNEKRGATRRNCTHFSFDRPEIETKTTVSKWENHCIEVGKPLYLTTKSTVSN